MFYQILKCIILKRTVLKQRDIISCNDRMMVIYAQKRIHLVTKTQGYFCLEGKKSRATFPLVHIEMLKGDIKGNL